MFNKTKLIILCASLTLAYTQQYGVRLRWSSNSQACTNPPDAIEYWPIGSPFAEQGTGTCVEIPLASGGHAYYTYSTTDTIPTTPASWSPFYAQETFYEDSATCVAASSNTAASVVMTNSDSCIFMGASTTGYHYLKKDCTSANSGQVLSCKDSSCTDCRTPYEYTGGCDAFVNSVHSCSPNTLTATPSSASSSSSPSSEPAPAYGIRMRWVSNAQGCTNEPDSIDFWPLGSPFAYEGSGNCVEAEMRGGSAYYTYTTSATIPQAPSTWSPLYASKTYYQNDTACNDADPSTVQLVSITNSDSCVFMGQSSMGYNYQKLDCTSESSGQVLTCKDSACTDCRAPSAYTGGCDAFVNRVNACAAH